MPPNTTRWVKRAFRLWLVLALPLGIYCAYQAFSYSRTAAESEDLANRWWETELKHEREGTKGTFDSREARREMLENKYSSIEKRNNYALVSALLLTLPLSSTIVFLFAQWVWGKPPGPQK